MSIIRALKLAAFASFAVIGTAQAQQRFPTPEAAADALVAAARAGDRKATAALLGPGADDILSSGDATQDATTRQLFLEAYDINHRVVAEAGKPAFLVIGREDWPLPIPIVQKDGQWQFDAAAGRQEILARRIGRNELAAIQVALAYVDAQYDYADLARRDGGQSVYAQKFFSSPGKKDGLYWPAAQGETDSPLGSAVAAATAVGYRVGGARTPFHGYYYKILTRQGPAAPGGAVDYVVNGKMIGGFALVAYPAQYGNSGVMTFIVDHDGVVYEKDLGPNTAKIASAITAYDPDSTWKKVATELRR
jgi:hypothetical protein